MRRRTSTVAPTAAANVPFDEGRGVVGSTEEDDPSPVGDGNECDDAGGGGCDELDRDSSKEGTRKVANVPLDEGRGDVSSTEETDSFPVGDGSRCDDACSSGCDDPGGSGCDDAGGNSSSELRRRKING